LVVDTYDEEVGFLETGREGSVYVGTRPGVTRIVLES
jgi:hypothetical protein